MTRGFTLVELLVAAVVVGILASAAIAHTGRDHQRMQLDVALRRLRLGLDRGRLAAERERQPCGLSLTAEGWQPPLDGSLPACRAAATPLAASGSVAVTLRSNLPAVVRFSTKTDSLAAVSFPSIMPIRELLSSICASPLRSCVPSWPCSWEI